VAWVVPVEIFNTYCAASTIKKNLDTSLRQPGSLKPMGADSDKRGEKGGLPDVAKLSEEEFDALPESTKARMRGGSL
jgi:hypothetical protein